MPDTSAGDLEHIQDWEINLSGVSSFERNELYSRWDTFDTGDSSCRGAPRLVSKLRAKRRTSYGFVMEKSMGDQDFQVSLGIEFYRTSYSELDPPARGACKGPDSSPSGAIQSIIRLPRSDLASDEPNPSGQY
ncbi:hypothetical protein BS47DRAFT_1367753 [Hydnum rufescens UP504]|uniref:Uncharacterized protein n=1 Tax=Hydnum rufescens UP504 TaxID=1448309 RepID=A0A9P6DP43_9AGAM|nr:hypothetical protein BS47DRAFT_1367753 [Hydnum rufescens UP504]